MMTFLFIGLIMLLYKYRGIKEFKFFADIILKNRLYAAKYNELNDPMEGLYLYSKESTTFNQDVARRLKGEKDIYRVCSLSENDSNDLMWSHYADSHKGVAIGVAINTTKYLTKNIQYNGLFNLDSSNIGETTAVDILIHKHEVWEYEKEVRVFSTDGTNFVNVDIKTVTAGFKMSNQDYSLVRDLINKVNPNIEVSRRVRPDIYVD